jgi:hypothetical protein
LAKRTINISKRRHEVRRYARELTQNIYNYSSYITSVEVPTIRIAEDGLGTFYLPSQARFEQLHPDSPASGIIFQDGSFLTVKEIFCYDYANETDVEPQIVRSEFSYHYQNSHRQFFFRYDHHPQIGDMATHPRYHLHVGCWHPGDTKLPITPRFRVPEVTLEEVLELIIRDFLISAG